MEVERSLHQIWFFLFVFVVLCLLLFWSKRLLCSEEAVYKLVYIVKGEILLLEGNKKERQDTRSYIVKRVRFNAVNGSLSISMCREPCWYRVCNVTRFGGEMQIPFSSYPKCTRKDSHHLNGMACLGLPISLLPCNASMSTVFVKKICIGCGLVLTASLKIHLQISCSLCMCTYNK
jgi:hypothetical protein